MAVAGRRVLTWEDHRLPSRWASRPRESDEVVWVEPTVPPSVPTRGRYRMWSQDPSDLDRVVGPKASVRPPVAARPLSLVVASEEFASLGGGRFGCRLGFR